MERSFFGDVVRQNHKTGFFCINDLTKIGNIYRKNSGLSKVRWDVYIKSNKTREFINSLMKQEDQAEIIKTTKGRRGTTWVHPLIFFDYAMFLSADFKIYVYNWMYDNLNIFRDDSGDSYKKMSKELKNVYTPGKCAVIITKVARAIKRDLKTEDWNKTTQKILKQRDEIHKNMILLLKAGVEPVKAYKLTVKEVLKN